MMWLGDCSFAPHSPVGVDAIPHLYILAQKSRHQFLVCSA